MAVVVGVEALMGLPAQGERLIVFGFVGVWVSVCLLNLCHLRGGWYEMTYFAVGGHEWQEEFVAGAQ